MLDLKSKIVFFKKRLFLNFRKGFYRYPEDDIADYFFMDYDENDITYNETKFKFLKIAKSEKDILQISDLLVSKVLKYDDADGLENIIENFINNGFLLFDEDAMK